MILEIKSLSKAFGGIKAVDNVSLRVDQGELSSIIGPNGAGKTTLFNIITGHIAPDSGQIIFKGQDITGLPPYVISSLGIARSFQKVNIFSMLRVFENIQVALLSAHGKGKELFSNAKTLFYRETEEILEIIGLKGYANELAGSLSHGDQKRLEVGIALGGKPQLLLLDEPTAGMSPEDTLDFTEFIRSLAKEKGISILFVEHDMNVVFSISDKIRVMASGQIISEGSPDEIRKDKRVQSIYFSGIKEIKESRPAINVYQEYQSKKINRRSSFLSVKEIDTFYGLSHILFKVSLEVSEGEIVCLLGRNGVGKTTTLRSIMGLVPPKKGRIEFLGENIVGKPAFKIARMGIGFVPENRLIFPDLTVRENLEIAIKDSPKGNNWNIEKVYQIFPILAERQNQKGGTLSGGEQQMLTIARTLMGNPQLMLLDEPSEGLAPIIVNTLYDQLISLKQEGMPILLSEQNFAFALSLSDKAYILEKGKICWSGESSVLKEKPAILKQYLSI
jgi:branched-chain amino acid transport system ATP-binding protein